MNTPIIYWFRQDLRTHDLPGLAAAAATGRPLLACYILDDKTPGDWRLGGASRWWLHHSLQSMDEALRKLGGRLILRSGETGAVLDTLIAESGADSVYCSQHFEPWAIDLEQRLHADFEKRDLTIKRFPGLLLFQPGTVLNQSGLPFKVYTPFWRACRAGDAPPLPRPCPTDIAWHTDCDSESLDAWALRPTQPDWAAGWSDLWQPGEAGASRRLKAFLDGPILDYSEGRDHPALDCTSRLSPHLRFGEISPREIWQQTELWKSRQPQHGAAADKFLSELGWREFSYHLLYHFRTIPEKPFKEQFEPFPWLGRKQALKSWQRGHTGYPIVDAGMRELWQTGYMHNRVRMVVASFLTKHLLTHWRAGEDWFWDTLLDADLANNACSWQWVAGSGADAAPYFRIFNPVTQGEKFDKGGDYVRRWVPEIAKLPDKYLHHPWEAPGDVLEECGITLGDTYPEPIVDHKAAREAALAAYGSIKAG